MAYMRDKAGRRLDSFQVAPREPFRATSLFRGVPIVASRSGNLGSAYNLSNGTDTSLVTRVKHKAFTELTDVRFVYANIANGSAGPNDITVQTSLELPGSILLPVYFNGQRSVTIGPNAYAVPDPLPLPPGYSAGAVIWSRTHVTAAAGGKWPLNVVTSNSSEGTVTNGAVALTNSGTIANSFTFGYGPLCAIGGTPAPVPSVAIIGDSIAAGQGDSASGEGSDYGFIQRALYAAQIGYVSIAKPGDTAAAFVAPAVFSARFAAVAGCTHAIVEYGINDVNTGVPLATMQANALAIWRAISTRGVSAFQTTLTPAPTASNTAPAVNEAARVGFNNWVRAGAPVDPTTKVAVAVGTSGALLAGAAGHYLTGYFEIADIVETARDSGLWKTGYSSDFLHPIASTHALMAAGINTARLAVA